MIRTTHKQLLEEILVQVYNTSLFRESKKYMQHGSTSIYRHSVMVAYKSCEIAEKYNLEVSYREMIRGALLHDYFLYDWHVPDREHPHTLHGFYHPGTALRNALREYKLTKREMDIIKKHMWPLTVVPPRCREAWIVTTADKWCSLMETLHMRKGHGAILQKLRKE